MTKKKSIWVFVLTLCLIVPAMIMFAACGESGVVNKLDGASMTAEGEFEKGSSILSSKIEKTDDSYSSVMAKISDKEYNEDKVAVFDISLENNKGAKVQPNGKVKITMTKPFECEDGYITFHIKGDESVEALETSVSGANIVFETTSFSKFIVAGKKKTTPPAQEEAKVTALSFITTDTGYISSEKGFIYTVGDELKPLIQNVAVYGVKTDGNVLLNKDVDYTVDDSLVNYEQVGEYVVSFVYTSDPSIKNTLKVKVVSEENRHISFAGQIEDTLQHSYNGAAVFVSKNSILINGLPLSKITQESIVNKISYVWRDKTTKTTVTPDLDITITGESYTYGVNRDMTVGDEFAGPCVVGEYEFALSYNGNERIVVDAKITESSFKKITSVSEFEGTTASTIFGEICYYTIVGIVDGKMYVMQMPSESSSVADAIVEAEARLVTRGEDGSIVLGGKYDFVFTPMRYFESEWRYYPETSTEREDLLVDFCTGYYGARTATIGLATQVINRTGWTKLSGDRIVREKGEYVGINYGNLTKFAEDGAVTIYAPRKGETENNALRLVKDGDRYVFTGKDKTTDSRESFPVYVYKQYVEPTEKYEFNNKLDKQYDGTEVSFNAYKDLIVKTESGEDIGSLLKMGTVRFVFKDLKDNFVMFGNSHDDGTITGPSAVGQYKLVIQLQEKGKDGTVWVDKAELNQFDIFPKA